MNSEEKTYSNNGFFNEFEKWFKSIRNLAFLLPIILILINLFTVLFEKKIIIEPFHVSNEIIEQGFDGEIISAKVLFRIKEIQNSGKSSWFKDFYAHKIDLDDNLIELPKSNFDQIINYFISRFDRNTYIKCRIAIGEKYVSVLNFNDKIIEIEGTSLQNVIDKTAIGILEEIDPLRLMAFFHVNDDPRVKPIAFKLINDEDKTNDGFSFHYLGSYFLKKGEFETARKYFQKALQNFQNMKDQTPTLNNLGVSFYEEQMAIYNSTGKFFRMDSAKNYYYKALNIDSTYFRSYANLGNLSISNKKWDSAFYFFEKALFYQSNDPLLFANLASISLLKKDTLKADSIISLLSDIRPINVKAFGIVTVLEYDIYKNLSRTLQYLDSIKSLDNSYQKSVYQKTKGVLLNKVKIEDELRNAKKD